MMDGIISVGKMFAMVIVVVVKMRVGNLLRKFEDIITEFATLWNFGW